MTRIAEFLKMNGLGLESADVGEQYPELDTQDQEISQAVDEVKPVVAVEATLESLLLALEASATCTVRESMLYTAAANAQLLSIGLKSARVTLESEETPEQSAEANKTSLKDKLSAMAKALAEWLKSLYKKVSDFIASLVNKCRDRVARARTMLQKLRMKGNKNPTDGEVAKESATTQQHSFTAIIGDNPDEYESILQATVKVVEHVLDVSQYERVVKGYVENDKLESAALPLIPPTLSRRMPGKPVIDFEEDNATLVFRLTEELPEHASIGVALSDTPTLIKIIDLVEKISSRVVEFGTKWKQLDHFANSQLVSMIGHLNTNDGETGVRVKCRKLRNLLAGFAQAPRGFGLYSTRLADAAYEYVSYCCSRY